jgi:hypothetical protein
MILCCEILPRRWQLFGRRCGISNPGNDNKRRRRFCLIWIWISTHVRGYICLAEEEEDDDDGYDDDGSRISST